MHTKAKFSQDRHYILKKFNSLKSDNVHYRRTAEKNKLFKENIEEKQRIMNEKNQEKFNDIDKKVLSGLLEKDTILRKLDNNTESSSKGKDAF